MNEKLDKELCQKYPKMFVNRYADMRTTAMCWGFSHSDGWYNIINMLCASIQNHIDWKNEQRERAEKLAAARAKGYDAVVYHLAGDYEIKQWHLDRAKQIMEKEVEIPETVHQVVVDQVKEKFGTLRFYYHGGDDITDGMVRMAEAMSSVTCEQCGKPGHLRGRGWLYTACDEHTKEGDERVKLEEDDEPETT